MTLRETQAGWLADCSHGSGLFARAYSAAGTDQNVALDQTERKSRLQKMATDAGASAGRRLFGMRQVHESDVVVVETMHSDEMPECDALVTDDSETLLSGVTADCVPLILLSEGACSVVHAGWRGLASGVIGNAVQSVADVSGLGAEVVQAFVGPSAGACCYEVGEEVLEAIGESSVSQNGRLSSGDTAVRQLKIAGVEAIETVDVCTICSPAATLNSFRRDGEQSGRQGVVAWLN